MTPEQKAHADRIYAAFNDGSRPHAEGVPDHADQHGWYVECSLCGACWTVNHIATGGFEFIFKHDGDGYCDGK